MEEFISANGRDYIINTSLPLTNEQRNEVILQLQLTQSQYNHSVISLGTPTCTTNPIKRGTTKDIPCTASSTNPNPNFTYTLSVNGVALPSYNSGVTTSPNSHTFTAVPFNTAGSIPVLLSVSDGCVGGTSDTALCNVTVEDPIVNTVTLTGCTTSIQVGATCTLSATCTDQFGGSISCGTPAWTSSNTLVATVSNGVVTGISAGTSTITATIGGKSATKVVTVACSSPVCSFIIL